MRGKIFVRPLLAMVGFLLLGPSAFPEDSGGTALLIRETRGAYSLVERSDWSRYDNGKYIGHVYREVRASILPHNRESGRYRGNYFVMEETLRDMRQSARAVNAVIPVSFSIDGERGFVIDDDRGFPELRNFPAFPRGAIARGTKWTARGTRSLDPLNEGVPVVVPLVAEYEYRGVEEYRNIPVHRIFAKYALQSEGQTQSREFRVRGVHTVDILLRVADGTLLMMRDNLDDTYTWGDGSTLRFRGFTLTFGEGLVPLDREGIIGKAANIAAAGARGGPPNATARGGAPNAAGGSGVPNRSVLPEDSGIDVEPVPEGVKLTIKDVRFKPDSEEILESERPRLDMIARVLKESPERLFLVEGHTAAVGRPEGEMELSVRRAQRITAELAGLGIPPERFIYKGWGGTKPLGDNATDEGRRLNRRVEITILE
jgi:outer membrane protein OmpA-like peptidoglycan-associated protein